MIKSNNLKMINSLLIKKIKSYKLLLRIKNALVIQKRDIKLVVVP
jgi:hypothetical protein